MTSRFRAIDPDAPRRPVNLRLNSDLVAPVREKKPNLSAIAEDAVRRVVAARAADA